MKCHWNAICKTFCLKCQFINDILYYHSRLGTQILLLLESLKFSNFTFLKGIILWTWSTWRKFVMYLEGKFYPSISLLENGRNIMPTAQYSSGRILTSISIISRPLLRNRHKTPPTLMPRYLCDLVHDKFCLCFTRGKAHGWGTFPKCEAALDYYCLVLGPLFWKCPHILKMPPS
jgi:hypothetical protein